MVVWDANRIETSHRQDTSRKSKSNQDLFCALLSFLLGPKKSCVKLRVSPVLGLQVERLLRVSCGASAASVVLWRASFVSLPCLELILDLQSFSRCLSLYETAPFARPT